MPRMAVRLENVCIDCQDPQALGRWWADLLGWGLSVEADDEVVVEPPESTPGPELIFCKVPEPKTVKDRLHLDLRPDDQAAEVARAETLGARRVDVGQGDQTWVVLADPEGNEFCILRALPPAEASTAT